MDILKKQVEEAVYDGYALDNAEFNESIYSIGVPIIIGFKEIEYGLGLSLNRPFSDYELKEYVKDLQYISRQIASLLQKTEI